ncbi:MAG: ECF transporter S component [Oscillospiraceae bacterium]|nr:ECF transporter S component [Oscillospiraceae bacterium]
MSTTMSKTLEKPRLSVKVQTLAAFSAIVGAVAVPQIFHAIGAVSGLGTSLGEAFLPMHLPIILVGLLAGPYAGAAAGLLGPVASFALSGMPGSAMLPFMMIELCIYGLSAGLLRNVKMPTIGKVLISQIAGRVVRAAAILAAVYLLGWESVGIAVIWTSVTAGLFGIILQWALLPLIVYRAENLKKDEK